jgi:hypothetical protein
VRRSLVLAAVLALAAPLAGGLVVGDAIAQPDPNGFTPPPPEPPEGTVMRQPEHLTARPSGFWTSNRPAVGGAYRYRIMGMGAIVLLITIFFLRRMLRRVSATRTTSTVRVSAPRQRDR